MAFINMRMDYDIFTTPIPNAFIDDYLPLANPAYATIYIFAYRHCFHGNGGMNTGEIAEKMNLLESDVINAWKYWEGQSLIRIHPTDQGNFDIEFLQVPTKHAESTQVKPAKAKETPKPLLLERKPEYSVAEIDIYMDTSEEVRDLFALAQKCLAKPLTYNDMQTIYGFYDWLRLPFDVIQFLLEYCSLELDKRSLRYIEKVALDWSDHSIQTLEQAREYSNQFNNLGFRKIMKAFGQSNAEPSPSQMKYMKKWVQDYKMAVELLEFACDKTRLATGKASFAYADKMITEWHEKHVTTLDGVQKLEELFHESKKKTVEKSIENKPAPKPTQNRFVNFEQSDWDFDKLQQLEEEYIKEKLAKTN